MGTRKKATLSELDRKLLNNQPSLVNADRRAKAR